MKLMSDTNGIFFYFLLKQRDDIINNCAFPRLLPSPLERQFHTRWQRTLSSNLKQYDEMGEMSGVC